jgi:hypothetical protein
MERDITNQNQNKSQNPELQLNPHLSSLSQSRSRGRGGIYLSIRKQRCVFFVAHDGARFEIFFGKEKNREHYISPHFELKPFIKPFIKPFT